MQANPHDEDEGSIPTGSLFYAVNAMSGGMSATKYNSKVMLCTGFTDVVSYGSARTTHLWNQLKFLVGRDRTDLLCLGGPWVSEMDGTDPQDNTTLIRTAMYVLSLVVFFIIMWWRVYVFLLVGLLLLPVFFC